VASGSTVVVRVILGYPRRVSKKPGAVHNDSALARAAVPKDQAVSKDQAIEPLTCGATPVTDQEERAHDEPDEQWRNEKEADGDGDYDQRR